MRKFLKRKLVMVAMVMVLITSMSAVVFADTTLENGTYSIDVTSSAAMFKVIDGKLNVLDGKMSAVITLSGTGYEKLFMGTQEESMVSNEADAIQYIANEEGKYTFAIPVEALDTEINVAAHSTKNDTWYGRTLTFNSDTIAAIEETKVEEVVEATQEEVNPKTGDNNMIMIASIVLVGCAILLLKNKSVTKEN